jgi:hypothetical protein
MYELIFIIPHATLDLYTFRLKIRTGHASAGAPYPVDN